MNKLFWTLVAPLILVIVYAAWQSMQMLMHKVSTDSMPYSLEVAPGSIHLYGAISNQTSRDMRQTLGELPDDGTAPVNLFLNSSGGDIKAASEIVSVMKSKNIRTIVYDQCGSACTMLFAAGRERYAAPEAVIMFHGAQTTGIFYGAYRLSESIKMVDQAFYDHLSRDGVFESPKTCAFFTGRQLASYSSSLINLHFLPSGIEMKDIGSRTRSIASKCEAGGAAYCRLEIAPCRGEPIE
jgi:ATP-dependent protease ClpP protease subunit